MHCQKNTEKVLRKWFHWRKFNFWNKKYSILLFVHDGYDAIQDVYIELEKLLNSFSESIKHAKFYLLE